VIGLAVLVLGLFFALTKPDWFSVIVGIFFAVGGSFFVWASRVYWPKRVTSLCWDEQGLYWAPIGYTLRPKLIRIAWHDIAGVKLVEFPDADYLHLTESGLILGLRKEAPWPGPERRLRFSAIALRKHFGRFPWRKTIALHHHDWEWDPHETKRLIESKMS
jgi:hypothetical protein